MATWVRQGTGTAPSNTDSDLVGNYGLDNATAPPDFDPANVNSVRCEWTITGSGFSDDSWTNDSCAVVDGTGITEISQHPSAGGANLQNESEASDHTDSTGIPTALTVSAWEGAFVRGDGNDIPNEWVNWNKVMGPDGSTLTVSALTVTIDYTPAAAGVEVELVPASAGVEAQAVTPSQPLGGGFTFRGIESAITDAATATITINKPSGTVEGDFLIASIMLVSAGAATWQAPSGWAQLGTDRDANNEHQSVTFTKVAGASEPASYDFTVSDNVNRKHGTIAAYGGVDETDPIDVHTEVADGSAGGLEISLTSTVDGVLLYGSAFLEIHADVWTNADGMNTRYSEFDNDQDDFAAVGIFDELAGAAGVYTRTFNHEDTNNSSGHLIALNPAPGGSPVSVELVPASVAASAQASDLSLTALSTELSPASLATAAQALTPVLDPLSVALVPADLGLSAQSLNLSLSPLSTELVPGLLTTEAQVADPQIAGGGGISVVAAESAVTTTDTLTINRPTGTQTGDIMVVAINFSASRTHTGPGDNWVEIRNDEGPDGGGSDSHLYVYRREATGSDPASWDFTVSSGHDWGGGIIVLRGVDLTSPVDVHNGQASSSADTAVVAPGVTTTVANALLVGFFGINTSSAPGFTAPGSMTEQWDTDGASALVNSSGATEDFPTAGATGDRTATADSAGKWAAALVAFAPSAAGAGVQVELAPASLVTSAQVITPVLDPLTVELVTASMGISSQALTPDRAALNIELLPASLIAQAQALDLSLGALATELTPASLQTLAQAFSPVLDPLTVELTPGSLALSAQALDLSLTALTTELAPASLQTIAQALALEITGQGVTVELVPASLALDPQALDLSLGPLSVVLTPATTGVSAQALSPDLQALAIELVAASMGVSAQSLSPDLQALAVELAPAIISVGAQELVHAGLVTVALVPASLETQALIMDTDIEAIPIPSGSDLDAVYRRSRVRRARGWQRPPSWR